MFCSEPEPSDDKDPPVEKKEQPVQEPGDEFVETWESYESEEDSVTVYYFPLICNTLTKQYHFNTI